MYSRNIQEQQSKGFIKCADDQLTLQTSVHYIPHHAVEKDSTTTPIHIVFDCSCHQPSRHSSLNDCLTIGAPCDNDLCALLVGFRSHCFGLSTNIEKAFLHVWLHPDDRNYTQFFWLSDLTDPSSPLFVCRFKVVPFGANSSPFMLNAVLHYHFTQYNTPVSNDMLRNLYVDNIMSGCETEQDYYSQARTIMDEARLS